jgi:hypothetical protein
MIDKFLSWLAGRPMKTSPLFIPFVLFFAVLAKYTAGPTLPFSDPSELMLSGFIMAIGGIAAASLVRTKEE